MISGVLLLATTILIFRFAKNHRYLVTGWLWYLGTLVPVIGLVQVGQQALADRYTYITLTGLFIIIAWGLPDLLAGWRYKKIALTLSMLLIILAMSVCTYFQLRHWQNSLTLFQHALDVTGDNYTTRLHLAESLCEQNMLDEAIEKYQKCLQEIPDRPDAFNNLGIALGKQGKFDEAIKYFTEALRIKPDFANAHAKAHTNLGIALAAKGKFAEAVRHYRIALETMDIISLHRDLGYALLKLGRYEEAAAEYRKVLSAMPNDADGLNNLGYALVHMRPSGNIENAFR
jgi:tetratricopeptide (TPR) repeat protein